MTQQLDHAKKKSVAIITSSLNSIRDNLHAARYFIALTQNLRQAGFTTILYSTDTKDLPAADAYIFHGRRHQEYHGLPSEKRLTSLLFNCHGGINPPATHEWIHEQSMVGDTPDDYYHFTDEQQVAISQLANRIKVQNNKDYTAGTFQRR